VSRAADPRVLPLGLCIGWGAGTLVSSTLLFATNTLLLRFMTDYLGVAAATAGFLFAISKIYDAASDPVIGVVSDTVRSDKGRRRPFLFVGTFMAALSLVLLFNPPALAGGAMVAYMGFALVFFSTAYTVFNVPYLAMPAEMTPNRDERSFLITFRVYGGALAQMIVGTGGPFLLSVLGETRAAHGQMAMALAIVALVGGLVCFRATRGARFTQPTRQRIPITERLQIVLGEGRFRNLLYLKVIMLFGVTAHTATKAFYTRYNLDAPDSLLALLLFFHTGGMLASQYFWYRVSTRLGKRATYTAGALIYVAASLSWLAFDAQTPRTVLVCVALTNGLAAGAVMLMSNALLPDAIAAASRRTGINQEGTFASMFTMVEKIAHAASVAVIGSLLGVFGYQQAVAGQAAIQSDTALVGIVVCFTILPASAMLASLLFVRHLVWSEERDSSAGSA
jgi:GPH family glycoside/pentoside/hexuronide:cation symporter